MAEKNGSDLGTRVSVLELGMTELKDALLVHALLEAKAAQRIKEHAKFLVDQEAAIARHEAAMARHEIKMAEFDDKLNALIDIIGRQQNDSAAS